MVEAEVVAERESRRAAELNFGRVAVDCGRWCRCSVGETAEQIEGTGSHAIGGEQCEGRQ